MLQLAAHARHAKAMQAMIKAAPILPSHPGGPSAQQPPVPPQPEPTAAAAKLTEAATYLAMIKKVQDEFNGSGSQQHSGAAMSAPRDFAVTYGIFVTSTLHAGGV
jgi:hypothetical protein